MHRTLYCVECSEDIGSLSQCLSSPRKHADDDATTTRNVIIIIRSHLEEWHVCDDYQSKRNCWSPIGGNVGQRWSNRVFRRFAFHIQICEWYIANMFRNCRRLCAQGKFYLEKHPFGKDGYSDIPQICIVYFLFSPTCVSLRLWLLVCRPSRTDFQRNGYNPIRLWSMLHRSRMLMKRRYCKSRGSFTYHKLEKWLWRCSRGMWCGYSINSIIRMLSADANKIIGDNSIAISVVITCKITQSMTVTSTMTILTTSNLYLGLIQYRNMFPSC